MRGKQRGFLLNPYRFGGGGGGGDPDFASVKALLHFDGADGSSTITDQIGANTWTPTNAPLLSTTKQKFGPSSMYFAGANKSIQCTSDFDIGTNEPFCIEMFINMDNTSSFWSIWSLYVGGTASIYLYVGPSGELHWLHAAVTNTTANGVIIANTWHHVALVRLASNVLSLYVDGVEVDSNSSGTATAGTSFRVGYDASITGNRLTGYVDEMRVSIGVPRYLTAFTPPSAAFPNS